MLLVVSDPCLALELLADRGSRGAGCAPCVLFLRRIKVQHLHRRLRVDANRIVVPEREGDDGVAMAVASEDSDAVSSAHVPDSNFAVRRARDNTQTVKL